MNESLAGELEVKQAELTDKQAELTTAAQEATTLHGRLEEQEMQEARYSQLSNAKEANDSLAGQLEAKQAELNTAAEEAKMLQGRFEEQGRQLTQRVPAEQPE